MKKFIMCELVEAENVPEGRQYGFAIAHEDGTRAHATADHFEKHSIKVTPNPELTNSDISVSQDMVDEFIAYTEAYTMGENTTVVRCVLRNGFVIVESSSCVDPKNYSEKMGKEICMKKIEDKIWELLGFLLATAKNGIN